MVGSLSKLVAKTRAYSDHFGLPLTPKTLHRWLITPRLIPMAKLRPFSSPLTQSQRVIIRSRRQISQEKLLRAKKIAQFISIFPTIRLICATGSLAIGNAKPDDDLDLMVITSADTLWLTRPLVILFLKALGLRRPAHLPEHSSAAVSDKACDNLWLDETALALPESKRNLYTAHEVLQARPLFDRGGVYHHFITANSWTSKYLANAYKSISSMGNLVIASPDYSIGTWQSILQYLFSILNYLAFKLQYLYMKKNITHETITLHSAYFHPRNLADEIDHYMYH